jgi:membrane-bound ClpP family serine protease
MNRRNFAFGKPNYIFLAISLAVIVVGLILMSGPSTTEKAFEPDIFSTRRIVVAPMVCLAGFVMIVVAVLWRPFKKTDDKKMIEEYNKKETEKPAEKSNDGKKKFDWNK